MQRGPSDHALAERELAREHVLPVVLRVEPRLVHEGARAEPLACVVPDIERGRVAGREALERRDGGLDRRSELQLGGDTRDVGDRLDLGDIGGHARIGAPPCDRERAQRHERR